MIAYDEQNLADAFKFTQSAIDYVISSGIHFRAIEIYKFNSIINTAYQAELIDLSKVETVTGFRYLPRAEKDFPGMIREYRVYVKPSDFKY